MVAAQGVHDFDEGLSAPGVSNVEEGLAAQAQILGGLADQGVHEVEQRRSDWAFQEVEGVVSDRGAHVVEGGQA